MFIKFFSVMVLCFVTLFSIFQVELLTQQYLLQFPHSTALQFIFFGIVAIVASSLLYYSFRQKTLKQSNSSGISIAELSIDLPSLGTNFFLGFMKGLGSR